MSADERYGWLKKRLEVNLCVDNNERPYLNKIWKELCEKIDEDFKKLPNW